jgi:hypothetical protein
MNGKFPRDCADCAVPFVYDGHAVNLWWKSTRGVVADEPQSELQVSHREVWERRSNSKIVA